MKSFLQELMRLLKTKEEKLCHLNPLLVHTCAKTGAMPDTVNLKLFKNQNTKKKNSPFIKEQTPS